MVSIQVICEELAVVSSHDVGSGVYRCRPRDGRGDAGALVCLSRKMVSHFSTLSGINIDIHQD